MEKKVKCYIVNSDISLFEYEILDGVKTFQIEIISKSKKRYILGNYNTMKEAKNYIQRVLKVDLKEVK